MDQTEYRKFPTLFDWVIGSSGFIFLIIGYFYDLEISQHLVDLESPIGNFTAVYGEVPGYFLISIALLMILVFHTKQKLKTSESFFSNLKFVTVYFLVVLAIAIANFLIINHITSNLVFQVIFTLLLPGFVLLLIWNYLQPDEFLLRASEKIVKITLIFPLLIVSGIKTIWGRVRFRNLMEDYSNFTPWYLPQGYSGSRSFPSGHSAMAWMVFAGILYIKDRTTRLLFVIIAMIWGILVSLGRILIGAHYLSDVIFSTISGLLVINYYYRSQKIEFKEYG